MQLHPDVAKQVSNEKEWRQWRWLDLIPRLKGKDDRQNFVLKVFSILTAQTLFTVFLWAIIYAVPALHNWFQKNIWFYFVWLGISIILIILIVCFKKFTRKVPLNYIALFTYTFFESMMIGTLWTFYDVQGIFLAAVLCMVLFTTMTVVSWLTKKKPHILLMLLLCCLSMSIFVMFFLIFFTSRWIIIVCCFVMLAIGCIYVYIDVELIIGKYGLEYDEYIIGALLLYQDLIMIFLYLLAILGKRN